MLVGDRELISALTGALTLFASLYQMARERTVEEYRSTSDRPTSTVESPEHRAAEGPADERYYHRLSQPRVPLSPNQKCRVSLPLRRPSNLKNKLRRASIKQ
jgi:hypothetical protein